MKLCLGEFPLFSLIKQWPMLLKPNNSVWTQSFRKDDVFENIPIHIIILSYERDLFFHNLSLFTLLHIKLLCVFAMLLFSNVICWSTLSFTPCVTQSSNMKFNNLEKSKCITFVVYIFYLKKIYTQMWSSIFLFPLSWAWKHHKWFLICTMNMTN